MSAYIPEFVYGPIRDKNGYYSGDFGLVPWPEHLRPRESVELTKKGEAYAEAAEPETISDLPDFDPAMLDATWVSNKPMLMEAQGVFFLTITKGDRTSIATTIAADCHAGRYRRRREP